MVVDITKLKRDPSKVHAALKEVNGKIIALKPLSIMLPASLQEQDLVRIGATISILGIWCMVVDEQYYGISLTNSRMNIRPSITNKVVVDNLEYIEFKFSKGDEVLSNNELVCEPTLVYSLYNEIIGKGKTPWYISLDDMSKLLDSSKEFGMVDLSTAHSIHEMVTSSRCRQASDRALFHRHAKETDPYTMIPLKSVMYGANNTTAKIAGGYFAEGVNSALVNPSTRKAKIETLLRM